MKYTTFADLLTNVKINVARIRFRAMAKKGLNTDSLEQKIKDWERSLFRAASDSLGATNYPLGWELKVDSSVNDK